VPTSSVHWSAWFQCQAFGSKSDRIPFADPAQQTIGIPLDDVVAEPVTRSTEGAASLSEAEDKKARKGHGTSKLPDSVPRVEEIIPLEESKRLCPCCAKPMKFQSYGEKRETSIIPQHVRERVFKYEVYSCDIHPNQVVKASVPARAIEGVACDHGTLAHLATQKLVMSLPIERQADQLARAGAPIAASTLNLWFLRLCAFLVPVADADRAYIEKGNLAYSDDTSFRVQDAGKKGIKIHVGNEYLITNGADAAYMIYCHGRTDASAKEIIGNFQGVLVVDGHRSYKKIEGVRVASCWAHIRRYFVEAWKAPDSKTGDVRAQKPVELINALFEIDRRCRDDGKNLEELQAIRDGEARPVLDRIKAWMVANAGSIPPKSALGKAIAYLDSRWDDACRFLTDARIPLDNNLSERTLRKTVLGRKNFLFAGNVDAAVVIAKAYGVMAGCALCKVDPYKYLVWALDSFANMPIQSYDDITPRKYAAFIKNGAGGSAAMFNK
jgi:transposase